VQPCVRNRAMPPPSRAEVPELFTGADGLLVNDASPHVAWSQGSLL
jgi:hypothetical protein